LSSNVLLRLILVPLFKSQIDSQVTVFSVSHD
jgi:hypothetical protein